MSDKKLPLSKHEKLLLWVWRNALASGVVLAASYFLWGEIRTIQTTQLEINQAIIELNTQDSQIKGVLLHHLADVQNRFGQFEQKVVAITMDDGNTVYETRLVESSGKLKTKEVIDQFLEENSGNLPPFVDQDE